MARTAIVTGASRGIGRAIAEALAADGIDVVVNYRSDKESAELTATRIRQRGGGRVLTIQADVGKLSDLERLFQSTIKEFGGLDILVNNAGILKNQPLEQVTEEDFDEHFAVNVKGTYFATQLALKHMREGGRIINLSSSLVGRTAPASSVYAATKGAVEQITRYLAAEVAGRGVTINAVAPGPVKTSMIARGRSQEQADPAKRPTPLVRLGEPEDIAKVVRFLASGDSAWISGQVIRVNGGYL